MTVLSLAVLAALAQVPAADPPALVAGLGSARFADREAASATLVALGRKALPALRAARELRDPEVRSRAAALVVKIEGALLTQPSLVAIDFRDAPLPEVVKAVADQTGIRLALSPENSPLWRTRRVTLREPDPLPFWKALDRLCEAAHLQYNLNSHGIPFGREAGLPLFEGASRPTNPVCDSGPFRVSINSLRFERDVIFPTTPVAAGVGVATPRANPTVHEQFTAQLQVAGEPRLTLSQNGPLRIIEAVDARGQDLAPPAVNGGLAHRASGYFGFAAGSVISLAAPLTRPSQPGPTIRRFKGVVPVAVSTRKPSPLVIALAEANGRTFQNDDVAVTVHEVRKLANNALQTSMELTVRPTGNINAGASPGGPAEFPNHRPDGYLQQVEIADAQGRPLTWYQTSLDAEAGRMTLTLTPTDQTPAELRYFSLVRSTAEVPFDFADVPLP